MCFHCPRAQLRIFYWKMNSLEFCTNQYSCPSAIFDVFLKQYYSIVKQTKQGRIEQYNGPSYSHGESLSHLRLFEAPWTAGCQAPLFPSPGDLPNPGIKLRSPAPQEASLPDEPPGKPYIAIILLLKLSTLCHSHFSKFCPRVF